MQGHVARPSATELCIRIVIFIERLEHHDFIAWVDQGQHGRDHSLSSAATDRDFALGIEVEVIYTLVLGGDRIAERLGSPSDGILIMTGRNGCTRSPR